MVAVTDLAQLLAEARAQSERHEEFQWPGTSRRFDCCRLCHQSWPCSDREAWDRVVSTLEGIEGRDAQIREAVLDITRRQILGRGAVSERLNDLLDLLGSDAARGPTEETP